MKTVLATAMIIALGITGVSLWHAAHPRSVAYSSSQIYIHGTPVCLMRHGEEILASVGTCDAYGGQPSGRDSGNAGGSFGGSPRYRESPSALPPGHPPVGSTPVFGQLRKTPI